MIKSGRTDIPGYKQVEEASLGPIIDSMPDGIFILDKNGNIVFSNPAAQDILKREKSGLIGKSLGRTALEKITELEVPSGDGKTRTLEMRTVEVKWKNKSCNLAILRDVTECKEAGQGIISLSQRLISMQDKERREIGHALHDIVGGNLSILKLSFDRIRRKYGQDAIPEIGEISQLVNELADQVRYISYSVRPSMLDDFGLLEALNWYLERFQERTGIQINFSHSGVEERFPPQIETNVYRIIQESMTNAGKHSGAKTIDIGLTYQNGLLKITIKDDGCGFDPREISPGSGLPGMQDLAVFSGGSLTVYSSPGEGTCINCCLPLKVRKE